MGEEAQLIKKAQHGDILAFEELILDYQKRIYNYCYRMAGNGHDAEDLAQEVFIKVYRNLKAFKGNSQFSTWLYRIAHNTCIDKFRKSKTYADNVSFLDDYDREKMVSSIQTLPEDEIIAKEKYKIIEECILSLKPSYRSVIILRDIQNYSYEEISLILKLPMGTVKSYISRARTALRQSLGSRI